MKHVKFGSILTVDNGIIVHGCNAQGVMGAGVALQIKNKWPKSFNDYANFIDGVFNNVSAGRQLLTPSQSAEFRQNVMGRVVDTVISEKLVISSAITQFDYGNSGSKHTNYRAVYEAFEHILELAKETRLPVHYPLIGAGLGGGNWAIISEIIDTVFQSNPEIHRTLWLID
jgi:O-acetyl-ADP-ribose deacetylase (regulator of RNase III)